jgi:hypothetical protein
MELHIVDLEHRGNGNPLAKKKMGILNDLCLPVSGVLFLFGLL